MVAEEAGWKNVHLYEDDQGPPLLSGDPPPNYKKRHTYDSTVPEFTISHDACRTFEDAMSPKEWGMYVALWGNPVLYMKALPIEKCLKFLIVKGAVGQSGESVTIQVRKAINP